LSLTLVVRHNDQLNYAARDTSAGCRSPSPLVFGLRNGQLGSLMKKLLLASIPALILIPWLFALPLTALIFQKSAELAKEVTAWNKQCGDKPSYDDACMKKRYQISAELGKFVALVNDEQDGLRDISPDASNDFVNEINGRRKIMELEVRNALHVIRCLGVPASEPQCSAESAAIDEEKAALQAEYKQTHAWSDGTWISIPVSVSPAPKKP
jgi:hypothetical protein